MNKLPEVLIKNKLFLLISCIVFLFIGGIAAIYFQNTVRPVATPPVPAPKIETKSDTTEATITVWSWNTAAKALSMLIPEFNKVYPKIKVTVTEIPYNEANEKFRLAISNKTGFPDVWDTEGPVTAEYIQAGALTDITDQTTKYKNDFVAYKWTEVVRDGKIFALPWDSAPVGLFYRRDIFEKAGVDPNSIVTWDDFIAAGKKITKDINGDGKIDQYMTLMSKKSDVQDTFQILLSQYNGSQYNEQGYPTFNTVVAQKSVELMKKMLDANIAADVGWWTPEFYDGIKTGSLATLPQGVWMGGQIKEIAPALSGKWGVLPLPAVEKGGIHSAVRGGSNLAIASLSPNKDAAWKFIEFVLARKESQLAMYKKYDIFPALTTSYDDPVFSQTNMYFGNQNTSRLFIEAQKTMPLSTHYGIKSAIQINQIVSNQIILALNGTKTPKQALDDAQKMVVERYYK